MKVHWTFLDSSVSSVAALQCAMKQTVMRQVKQLFPQQTHPVHSRHNICLHAPHWSANNNHHIGHFGSTCFYIYEQLWEIRTRIVTVDSFIYVTYTPRLCSSHPDVSTQCTKILHQLHLNKARASTISNHYHCKLVLHRNRQTNMMKYAFVSTFLYFVFI